MYNNCLSSVNSNIAEEPIYMDKFLKREIHLARNIQTVLLNGETPTFQGGEVSGTSIPARIMGGDYFDFYPMVNGKIRIVIGDVMGKGIPAAMLMILTRGAFRSVADSKQSPSETLTAMNQALFEDLRKLRSFVSLVCADFDPKTRILTYANAGHNLPLFIKGKDKIVVELPKLKGVMIGGLPNQVYKEEAIQLKNDDTIFFYTDGIIEAVNRDGEQYKIDRLSQTLLSNHGKSVEELELGVMGSINQFAKGVSQKDDITMVILKVCDKNLLP